MTHRAVHADDLYVHTQFVARFWQYFATQMILLLKTQ